MRPFGGVSGTERAWIDHIPLDSIGAGSLETCLHDLVNDTSPSWLAVTNTESLYFSQKWTRHRKYLQKAAFSFCDGVALQLAGALRGVNVTRFHGPDLMLKCIEIGQARGWRHFFFGSTTDVLDRLTSSVTTRYPDAIVVGQFSPPFGRFSDAEIARQMQTIAQSDPDFIWVGLGLPKQEEWIRKAARISDRGIFVGVGAAFDFLSGNKRRSPPFFRNLGLEWLFRLYREPRMIPRIGRSILALYRAVFCASISVASRAQSETLN